MTSTANRESNPLRGRGPTRRGFLQGSAAAAAPVLLARPGRAAPAQDPDVLKVGLVGCGGRGTGAAAQALSAENGTVVLTALADLFPDKVEASLNALKAEMGEEGADRIQVPPAHLFAGFDAYQKLLASGVDVVILATAPYFRPAQLEAAIAAGKHVFTEKPMAVDAPGVRRVIAAAKQAEEKGLSVVAGFCWRRNALMRALNAELHRGVLGPLRAIHTTYNTGPLHYNARREGWTEMEWHLRNWQQVLWLSGDHIVEQAIHSLDMMSWAFQDVPPLSVTAIGGRQARSGEGSGNIYDHFGATFDYPGGVKGFHQCRQIPRCSGENKSYYFGANGWADVNPWADQHRTQGDYAWVSEKMPGHSGQMYQTELDELMASIRARTPINDGPWMAQSTMLAIMTRMAAYTGQTITWEQAMGSQETLGPAECALGDCPLEPVAIPGTTTFF
ncbi:MAG: Gfo/Idh/MocA family oxidoreductase [Planctomycetota bacterium]